MEFSVFRDYQKALDAEAGSILGREFKIKKSDRNITHKREITAEKRSNDDFKKMFS